VTTSLPKRRLDRRRLRPAGLPPSPSRKAAGASPFILLLEHIQGAVTAVVCIVLIVLACVLFISRITDTVDGHGGTDLGGLDPAAGPRPGLPCAACTT
jgi:hypothetical protein